MPLTKSLFQSMLQSALTHIEQQLDHLNQLDGATGDGDHGTAIKAAMQAACQAAQSDTTAWPDFFSAIGWSVMGGTAGSTSAIIGAFFAGMENAVNHQSGDVLDTDTFISLFEAGLNNVRSVTKAQIGDKTIMDAMIPGVEAMTALKGNRGTITEAMLAGAQAAQSGADSTKDLTARHGRARNLGERSRGHIDAGATSLAMIFQSFAEALR